LDGLLGEVLIRVKLVVWGVLLKGGRCALRLGGMRLPLGCGDGKESCNMWSDTDRPEGERGDGENGRLLLGAGDCDLNDECLKTEFLEGDLDKERRISPIAECGSI
jgi:hypothetical protein